MPSIVHQTFEFSADPSAPSPITVPTLQDSLGRTVTCRKVTIRPKNAASKDYDVRAPLSTNAPFRRTIGEPHVFTSTLSQFLSQVFQSGDIVGYVQPVSVTVIFSGLCES